MQPVAFVDDIPARWAGASPEAEAFRFLDDRLSYAALEARVQTLALALHVAGVRRGDRVAILLDKSLDSAVAVYGIMRAGAAYVPLDPGAPPARHARIIGACGIAVAITSAARLAQFETAAGHAGARVTALAATGERLSTPAGDAAGSDASTGPATDRAGHGDRTPDDLAYVIFTSGSTGVPKGIMHSHRTALAYARMSAALYEVTPADRLGNHSPLHFDMSTFDFFAGPLAGARTVIISEMHAKLPASLAGLIARDRVTIWYSVPHAIVQLVERGGLEAHDLSAMRLVIFGGEPMHPRQLRRFADHVPQALFSNCYGPAEVNQCTVWTFGADQIADDRPIPLGTATPHAELRIEHDYGADGAGELLVATDAMMLGYWNDPARTEQAIHGLAGGGDPAARRFYGTGDVVRRGEDGLLYFVGRVDRQVKLRGYRVELDEVEAALAGAPDVSEAAAIVTGDPAELVAHVRPAPGRSPTEAEIRSFAARSLPGYAVPARVILRRSFPRTGTGKIDRKKLKESDHG